MQINFKFDNFIQFWLANPSTFVVLINIFPSFLNHLFLGTNLLSKWYYIGH